MKASCQNRDCGKDAARRTNAKFTDIFPACTNITHFEKYSFPFSIKRDQKYTGCIPHLKYDLQDSFSKNWISGGK